MSVIIFKIILLLISILYINSHRRCNGPKKVKPNFQDTYAGKDKRYLQSATWSPIRIYVDYTYMNNQTTVNLNKIAAAKAIVNQTVAMFSNIIKVKPSTSLITVSTNDLSSNECPVVPSQTIQTTGVAADIIIFPFFDLKADEGTEAYAFCSTQDLTTSRPISGVIAFTSNLVLNTNWLEYNTYLIFHEMTHVFVFSSDLFSSFIDSLGNPIPMSKIMVNSTVNGLSRTKIITPKVVAAARKHFNCPTLDGVELENQGGSGTAGSHWEARVMLTDYMMGQSYDEVVISDITFALFEDSGWYQMNYYTGGLFRFGKNQGCNFTSTTCLVNGKSQFPQEYCDSNCEILCTNGRVSKGSCQITTFESKTLLTAYRYFGNLNGGYQLADFCPISQSESITGVYLPYNCVFGLTNQYPAGMQEKISDTSACFVSSLVNNNSTDSSFLVGSYNPICYSYTCNSTSKTVTITVGTNSVNCAINGGKATISGYSGSIICPDYNSVCTGTSQCRSMVSCVLNKVLTDPNSYVYSYSVSSDIQQLYNGNFNVSISASLSFNSTGGMFSKSDKIRNGILNSFMSFLLLLYIL